MFQKPSSQYQYSKTPFFFPSLLILGLLAYMSQISLVAAADLTKGAILDLINQERLNLDLKPLKENVLLAEAAKAKAEDMLQNDYFSHTSPTGSSPWYWVKRSGYSYQYAGENLAINYESAESQHQAWMKSPTHRANILSTKYTETGIAMVSGKLNGERATIVVQLFGAPRGTLITPARFDAAKITSPTENPVFEPIVMPLTVPAEPVLMPSVEATLPPVRSIVPASWIPVGFVPVGPVQGMGQWLGQHLDQITFLVVVLLYSVMLATPLVFTYEAWMLLLGSYHARLTRSVKEQVESVAQPKLLTGTLPKLLIPPHRRGV